MLNKARYTVLLEITIFLKLEKFLNQVTASSVVGCLLLTFYVCSQISGWLFVVLFSCMGVFHNAFKLIQIWEHVISLKFFSQFEFFAF